MLKLLKKWKSLTIIPRKELIVGIITNVICLFCAVVEPIALSSFISNATIHATGLALLWLAINLGVVIIEHISWHINYGNYTYLISPTYKTLQEKITSAMLYNNGENVDKQKLSYCINTDIFGIATFVDTIIIRACGILKFLIILIIIFVYSYVVGVLLVIMSAIGYLLLLFYNKSRIKTSIETQTQEIATARKTNEIIDMASIIKKYDLESPVLLEQERRLKGYVNSYNNLYTKKSIKDNFIQIYWYAMLTVVFVVCLFEYNALVLHLSVFLVLIDYSVAFIKLTENAFDFTIEITELEDKIKRTEEFINFAKASEVNVEKTAGESQNEQLVISSNKVFKMQAGSKKKLMLEPTKIMLFHSVKYYKLFFDEKQSDYKILYSNQEYNALKQIPESMLVTCENEMFADTILQNLQIINNDEIKIDKILKEFGISDVVAEIDSKPNNYANTIEDKTLNFLLNLTRGLLSDSKILILQLEDGCVVKSKDLIKSIKNLIENRIFLIYAPTIDCAGIGRQIVE